MTPLCKVKVEEDLKDALTKVIRDLGGMSNFVAAGDSVLLKPNYNSADPFPASTDLEFLGIVVQLVLDVNPKRIIIGESSAIGSSTAKIMERMAVSDLQSISPIVEIIDLIKEPWVRKRIPGARYLKSVHIPQLLEQVDKLILLPCLKTHFLAQFSGSLKLSVAFMKPRERIALHMRNLQRKIAELNAVIHPDLVIMDARKCFINGGPYKGDVREPGLLLASTSRVAIDVEGMNIIKGYPGNSLEDIDPMRLTQIKKAVEIGVGEAELV